MTRPTIAVAVAGVAVVLGALLPWATYESAGTESLFGLTTDGPLLRRLFDQPVAVTDGWIVLGLGVMLAATAFGIGRGVRWAVRAAWLILLTLTALVIFEVAQYVSESGVPTYYTEPHDSLGPGLFVVGGGTFLAAAALRIGRRPRDSGEATVPMSDPLPE